MPPAAKTFFEKYGSALGAFVAFVMLGISLWTMAASRIDNVAARFEERTADNQLRIALAEQLQQRGINDISEIKLCLENIKDNIGKIDKRLDSFIVRMDTIHAEK